METSLPGSPPIRAESSNPRNTPCIPAYPVGPADRTGWLKFSPSLTLNKIECFSKASILLDFLIGLLLGYWYLRFICYLVLGIYIFECGNRSWVLHPIKRIGPPKLFLKTDPYRTL